MVAIIVIAAIAVLLGLWFVLAYNGLVRKRNRVDNSWAQVDVQLKRRYDLIPNLVEAVRGYASHERDTLEAVIEARNAAQSTSTVEEQAGAENVLGSMLRRLFALAEQYPQLRATENFQALQAELSETEDKIAIARQIYNDGVLTYNNTVQTVPTNFVAAITGFRTREFFEVDNDARSAPEVQF
jgi:LemA protein